MARTMGNNAAGRIQSASTPSGDAMPPELAALIAQSMTPGVPGASAPQGVPISIRLGDSRKVHVDSGVAGTSGVPGMDHRPQTLEVKGTREFSTIDEAVNSFFLMDEEYQKNVMEKLYDYGLIDGPNNEAQAANAWAKAVEMAWNYTQAGKPVDPLDLLPRMTNLKAGELGGAPRTTTARSFNMMDPETAKAFVRQSFQAAMGRDPHDSEVRNLMRGLEQGFKSQPAVTQQTVDEDGNSTTRVLDPGFDQQAFVANQMDADPEARAYQAAAQLFPALQEALASP